MCIRDRPQGDPVTESFKMSNSLTGYYEKTYENEKEQTGIPLISYSKYPISRYEAVIKYFNDHFKGGDILELGAGNRSVAKMLLKMCIRDRY